MEDQVDEQHQTEHDSPPIQSTSSRAATSAQPNNNNNNSKKTRITTACDGCRKKRARCDAFNPVLPPPPPRKKKLYSILIKAHDITNHFAAHPHLPSPPITGHKPSCRGCKISNIPCVYDLQGDRRKPFTRDVVVALQMRIDALEKELAGYRNTGSTSESEKPTAQEMDAAINGDLPAEPSAPATASAASRNVPLDALQGGLALNSHGELRFYGPTSSYRAVLADSTSTSPGGPSSDVEAARVHSLPHAPVPTAIPVEPVLPRRPPTLTHEFHSLLVRLAFEYCFSQFGLVQEREFYRDLASRPYDRTHHYSPFLLNVVLAIGCRYLDVKDDYPLDICDPATDFSTRGDIFLNWSRVLLDQEWQAPKLSTVRGLICFSIYLAGRGLDGVCWTYCGQAMRLVENFGLHLGIHRLSMGKAAEIEDELIIARRDTFFAAFSTDVMLSMYLGRRVTYTQDEIDQPVPPIQQEHDFDIPMYRSSTFHYSSTLMLLASRVMTSVYGNKPGLSLETRKTEMSYLHLQLESWYHELPAHARSATTAASKAPHPHVIQLNLTYFLLMIILHRPFFRRLTLKKTCDNLSTQKCLSSAKHIVRLVKLQREAHGLRFTSPAFQHACFCAGTILAISAVEDQISETLEKDAERRTQAQADLKYLVDALRDVAVTWTTANTSARILDALMAQWGPEPPPTSTDSTHPVPDLLWPPLDTSSNVTFPFMFPSWDLDPTGALDELMTLLNPPTIDPTLADLPSPQGSSLYQSF